MNLARGLTLVQKTYFSAQAIMGSYRKVIDTVPFFIPDTEEAQYLAGPSPLKTCLKRTALGLSWEPGMRGGTDPYLCAEDVSTFEGLIVEHTGAMKCISTREALSIAHHLKTTRHQTAIALLESIGSRGLADDLREQCISEPDPSWLNHFCRTIGISIMNPMSIEHARRHSCNTVAIQVFFDRFSEILNRHPALILNCDETHVSSRKKFKVLATDGHLPLKECRDKLPHFSAMCTVSASGTKFLPTFILPGHKTLPGDLADFCNHACFISSESGWMTQRCFLLYAHFLIHELKVYCENLPVHLIGQRLLLILDGHTSRWSFEAIALLRDVGIDVLVLPAHCTHVLQAFDVSIAAPLKTRLAELCQTLLLTLSRTEFNELICTQSEPHWLADKRRILFRAFLYAWDEVATERNILSGFRTTGIAPLDVTVPLSNSNTRKICPNEVFEVPADAPEELNCCLVTRDETLQFLSEKPKRMFPEKEERVVDQFSQWEQMIMLPNKSGMFLSAPIAFLWNRRLQPKRFDSDDGHPKIFVYKRTTATNDLPWDLIYKLADNYQIHIRGDSIPVCKAISNFLKSIAVEHQMFHGRKEQSVRIRKLNDFNSGNCRVLITSNIAAMGLQLSNRVFTVFSNLPDPRILIVNMTGDRFVLFSNEDELNPLRKFKIQPCLVTDAALAIGTD
jgi:hypothetical protein